MALERLIGLLGLFRILQGLGPYGGGAPTALGAPTLSIGAPTSSGAPTVGLGAPRAKKSLKT